MPYTTLVTTDQLAAHPEWRIFDCRHELTSPDAGAAAYARAHIPGALHANLDRDLSSAKTGRNGRHPLPTLQAFTAWLGTCGLKHDDQVVAYDAADGAFAARLWWLLRAVGHTNVAVLDGGFASWSAESRPVTDAVPTFAATRYDASWRPGLTVTADEVLTNITAPSFTVVDARGANRYRGEDETIDPVGGHIPGALNRPYAQNMSEGRFKTPAQLRSDFESVLGGTPPASVVNQCGSGVTACHNLLALEVAGMTGARLYPGSWSEWSSDPARPVATGPTP